MRTSQSISAASQQMRTVAEKNKHTAADVVALRMKIIDYNTATATVLGYFPVRTYVQES